MFFQWSVVCIISDEGVSYTLVKGIHPEADFVGSKKECLKYIQQIQE
jgi:hypothetical protein